MHVCHLHKHVQLMMICARSSCAGTKHGLCTQLKYTMRLVTAYIAPGFGGLCLVLAVHGLLFAPVSARCQAAPATAAERDACARMWQLPCVLCTLVCCCACMRCTCKCRHADAAVCSRDARTDEQL